MIKLNIYHYITIIVLLVCFLYIYYETLFHKEHKKKRICRIINSSAFRLLIGCIYFVLLVIFTYETSNASIQSDYHPTLKGFGIHITYSMLFLLTILFFIYLKFKDHVHGIE